MRRPGFATSLLVVSAALVVLGYVYVSYQNRSQVAGGTRLASWRDDTGRGHRLGSPNAALSETEFTAYQSDACRVIHQQFADLPELHGDRVAYVYYHFPLKDIHPHAFDAAVAVECAARQERFANMHNTLFLHQRDIGILDWMVFAARAGVSDMNAFAECLGDAQARANVEQDRRKALELRLRGTPAIIINEWLFYGSRALDYAESLLSRSTLYSR